MSATREDVFSVKRIRSQGLLGDAETCTIHCVKEIERRRWVMVSFVLAAVWLHPSAAGAADDADTANEHRTGRSLEFEGRRTDRK